MNEELIAPCGMNCGVCSGYLALTYNLRSKGIKMPSCKGCRPRDKKCAFLTKKCRLLLNGQVQYCYECQDYPCERLRHIDERYKRFFKMSLIGNLEYIKKYGMKKLLDREKEIWRCPDCGEVICCHNGICFSCGLERLRIKRKLYRWTD
jgi:hypothetical protein